MPTSETRLRDAVQAVIRCHADTAEDDSGLVRRFVASRDERAFEALVRRHGPMVLGVCRRVVRDPHASEDAFQATFLQLARRAGSLRRGSLAGWLYTTARRSALRARRRNPAPPLAAPPTVFNDPLDTLTARELLTLIDEEVGRLPERYRLPLTLCYLDGLTREQAACRLGWSPTVLRGRLERGRARLQAALTRRGASPAVGLALLAPVSGVAPSAELVTATVQLAAGRTMIAPGVAALASVSGAGVAGRSLVAVVLTAGLGALVVAAGLSGRAPERQPRPEPPSAEAAKGGDLYGDPLPTGAVARLGTVRFRHPGFSDYVFLPDSKTVLSAGSDGVLRFWDLATGRVNRTVALDKHPKPGGCPTLSPNGKLFTADMGDGLVIWNVETGKVQKHLPSLKQQLGFLYFSPDGAYLAVGHGRRQVTLFDWRAGKEHRLPLKNPGIGLDSSFHVSFSPDGKRLAAGGGSGEPLYVFDLPDLKESFRLECDASVSTFSPDGRTLAVTSMNRGGVGGVLRLFESATGKETASFPLEAYYHSLAFSPDGKSLALGFSDDSYVMDLATGKVKYRLTGRPIMMAFTPDGKLLAASTGSRLRLWDAATGKEQQDRPGDIGSPPVVTLSPDGRHVATTGWIDQLVTLWDVETGRIIRQFPLGGQEKRYVRNLAFSADGKTLTALNYHAHLQSWEVATGADRGTVQFKDPSQLNPGSVYYYTLLAPDGRRAATLERNYSGPNGEATRLRFWDATKGELIREHPPLPKELRVAAWVNDGPSVALPLKDGLTVTDLATGKTRFTITGTTGPVAASPDGRLVAARKEKPGAVGVWEVATGREVVVLPTGPVRHLRLASDNRTLVAVGGGSLLVWDLATGRERVRRPLPSGAPDWAQASEDWLSLSPDGRRAVTVEGDSTGLVWDLTGPRAEPLVREPTDAQLAGWWADLAGPDAAGAYAAVWRLAESPAGPVVELLGKRLKPAAAPDAEMVRKLVADLDSDSFDTREKASRKLAELGTTVAPALRRALVAAESPEARQRLEGMLAKLPAKAVGPEVLRNLRAIQVLERVGSADARRLLKELADGAAHPRESEEAQAALDRLRSRP